MNNRPLVEVRDLQVDGRNDGGPAVRIVRDVSFTLARGEVLALIGESGSGKTTIAMSLLGYARRGCEIVGGSVRVGDTEVLQADAAALRALRGRRVAYVAQSAAAAFNPSRCIMDQVVESALIHRLMTREQARVKAVALFTSLALPDPAHIGERYPHQVSGGQLQRLMAAMALMTDPDVVVLDEPTTALDVTTQIEVLRSFKHAIRERGVSAIYVSHDLAVVAQMADRVIVLKGGEMQECAPIETLLRAPAHPYTASLLAAASHTQRAQLVTDAPAATSTPLLEVRGLAAGYGRRDAQGRPATRILDDINLTLPRGSALGVIGESGSGKTTFAWAVAGLVGPYAGSLHFDGKPLAALARERTPEHLRRIQMVFQNADTVLNPAWNIGQILARPLHTFKRCSAAQAPARVRQLLDMVKLPANIAERRPAELSGGQKQRVNLARALAAEPDLVLCDEVTSALDTVVGAAILDLLTELRRELGVSYLFISHDISTVQSLCDDVTVLYRGRQVDSCPCGDLRKPERHDYTRLLVESVPELRTDWLETAVGRTPSPALTTPAHALRG